MQGIVGKVVWWYNQSRKQEGYEGDLIVCKFVLLFGMPDKPIRIIVTAHR